MCTELRVRSTSRDICSPTAEAFLPGSSRFPPTLTSLIVLPKVCSQQAEGLFRSKLHGSDLCLRPGVKRIEPYTLNPKPHKYWEHIPAAYEGKALS